MLIVCWYPSQGSLLSRLYKANLWHLCHVNFKKFKYVSVVMSIFRRLGRYFLCYEYLIFLHYCISCNDFFLGIEKEYEQKVLPDGKINIDGFLCIFDVSVVPSRTLEKQVEMVTCILNNLIKTKKPVILVSSAKLSTRM